VDYRKMIAFVIRDWLEDEGSGGPFLPDASLTEEENAELQRISDEVHAAYTIKRDKEREAYRLRVERAIAENAEKIEDSELGWRKK
jgi:hypothetical protein